MRRRSSSTWSESEVSNNPVDYLSAAQRYGLQNISYAEWVAAYQRRIHALGLSPEDDRRERRQAYDEGESPEAYAASYQDALQSNPAEGMTLKVHREHGHITNVSVHNVPDWMSDLDVQEVFQEAAAAGNPTAKEAVAAVGPRWFNLFHYPARHPGVRLYLDA